MFILWQRWRWLCSCFLHCAVITHCDPQTLGRVCYTQWPCVSGSLEEREMVRVVGVPVVDERGSWSLECRHSGGETGSETHSGETWPPNLQRFWGVGFQTSQASWKATVLLGHPIRGHLDFRLHFGTHFFGSWRHRGQLLGVMKSQGANGGDSCLGRNWWRQGCVGRSTAFVLEERRCKNHSELSPSISSVMTVRMLILKVWV